MTRKWKCATIASGSAAAVAGLMAYGAVSPSSQLFGPYLCKGEGGGQSIALTFDDGPSESTPELLDFLDREHVAATFFQCGMNVARLPHIGRDVAARGHQIGNHTYSHPLLAMKRPGFIEGEFSRAQTVIKEKTGVTPAILRPPFGVRWLGMRSVQKRLGLMGIGWTVIGYDWKWPAERIARHVLNTVSPGGIIVLHDGRDTQPRPDVAAMLGATKTIVRVLKDRGYRFETIGDILATGH